MFQKHVTALAVKRLEKPKKMSAQNAKYWSEIVNQLYNFHRGICFLCLYGIICHKTAYNGQHCFTDNRLVKLGRALYIYLIFTTYV